MPLKLSDRLIISAGRVVVRAVLGFLRWSARIEIVGGENLRAAMESERPYIFAGWHGQILPFLVWRTSVQVPRLATMISRSRDGELVARIVEPLGIFSVRGSSSKGGAAALLEFTRYLGEPNELGGARAGIHFLDGPRGPRHKAKPGILALAQRADALVVPVCCGISRRWVTRSWDRHCIPQPFARIVCVFGEPLDLRGRQIADEEDTGATDDAPARAPGFSVSDLDRILAAQAAGEPLCRRDHEIPDIVRKPKRPKPAVIDAPPPGA